MISRHLPRHLLALALPTGSFLLPCASAQSTWNGGTNSDWANPANWAPGIPASGDDIIIANSGTDGLTLEASKIIGSLTFGAAGTRTGGFTLNTQAASTLTLNDGIAANGALDSTALTMRGHYIVATDQEWSIGGTGGHSSDQGIFIREVATGFENRGSLVLDGNLTKTGSGQLLFAAIDVSGAGNLLINAGTLKFNAGASQPLVVGGGGNITMNGSSTLAIYKNSGTMNITRDIVMNGTSAFVTRNNPVDVASAVAWTGTHSLDAGGVTNLTGAWTGTGTVNRIGAGALTLSGNSAGFSGTLNLGGGSTRLAADFGGNLNLNSGAGLSGEVNVAGDLSLNGGSLIVDPLTVASLGATGNLTLSGVNTVNLVSPPVSSAPFNVLTYGGTLAGGPANLTLPGGLSSYRSAVFSDATPNAITLSIDVSSRTWNGGAAWDIGASANWLEGDQRYYNFDAVVFGDTGAGTVALTGNLTPSSISIASSGNYTFTAAAGNFISGTTGISKSGTGIATLGGVNTFTGGIQITGGTLRPSNSQALGANGQVITISGGGTLDTNGAMNANRDYHAVISGAGVDGNGAIVNSGTSHSNGFGTITLAADAAIGGTGRWDLRPITAGAGVLDLAGFTLTKSGANTIAIVDSVSTAAGSIQVNAGVLALTRSVISGAGSINVNPSATLQLENYTSGSITKAISIDNANLILTGNAFTLGSDITLANTATVTTNVALTLAGSVGGTGNLAKAGTSSLILTGDAAHSGGTTVSAGTLQIGAGGTSGSIAGNIVNSATVNFNRSDAHSYGGAISGSGALVKQGAGTLTLTGDSSYAGATTINGGILAIGGGHDRLPVATNVTLANLAGVGLDLNGFNQEIRSLNTGGTTGGHVVNTGAGPSVLMIRPGTGDNATFSGQISGDVRLEIVGGKTEPSFAAPRQRLAGIANSFTGGILIDGATLLARQDGSLGAVPESFQADNITLRNNGTLFNEAAANFLTLDANRGITLGTGGGGISAGFGASNIVTVRGVISGEAGNDLTVLGNEGTVIFTGNNTYAGGTSLPAANSRLQIGDGGTSGALVGDVSNNGVLTFNRSNDSSYDGDISGAGTLTKTGAGSLALNGNSSTYTGAVTVSAGTLLVNGSLGSTAVSIAAGATLGGNNGIITGTVTAAAASSVISPGNSPGTITLGGLNAANGATFGFELGSTSDLLTITGVFTAGGTLTFNFSDAGGVVGGMPYTLITFGSQTGLDYDALVAATLPGGLELDTTFGNGGWSFESGNSLQVQFIPEPSSALLGGLGLLLALRRRRD